MSEIPKTNPIRETDDEARFLARSLISQAGYASIAVLEPGSGYPLVSRIAMAMEEDGSPLFFASDLSGHSQALARDPRASVLCGEPGPKGDPLTHPRVTLIGRIEKLARDDAEHGTRRDFWLSRHPKAKLYVDFGDFHFYRMRVERVHLNGGFGKAFQMDASDLAKAASETAGDQ